ncbi:MAG: acyclic terpene utilization AtuA family protein [Qingshengfaniella sp.]
MNNRILRIGGASGAWGDSPMAIGQLLTAKIDYLTMDYLAEVTMSLMARARMKNPAFGFPPDAIAYLKPHLPEIARRGIKVVTNAGGVNPLGCKAALEAVIAEAGLDLTVAAVTGDDLLPQLDQLRAMGLHEAETGAPIPDDLLTANAYLGALPVRDALAAGADIVVTGRCADSALALGALMHEFGWAEDAHDLLAAGSLVGHVLECGPQATGGTFTDWADVEGWDNIGYPIAAVAANGSFEISKPEGTGGLVSVGTVSEQVLYEIGDPAAYILPDVVADFSGVQVEQSGPNRVRLTGARGRPPTPDYKVSATWQDGWRAVLSVSIVGPDAGAKAEKTARAMIDRAEAAFARTGLPPFRATRIEALGAESAYSDGPGALPTREVLLRLVVDHEDRGALNLFAREAGSIGISMAPGTTGIYSGRPKPSPVVRLFTLLVPKLAAPAPQIHVADDDPRPVAIHPGQPTAPVPAITPAESALASGPTRKAPLRALAWARSGDKGNRANIAIIARRPEFLPFLRREVTPERILAHFSASISGPVDRFDAPGLNAMNFLLGDALGGGGMASQRIDPQGKAYGQMALEMELDIPEAWL